jgi:ATP-dependent DNA ligase
MPARQPTYTRPSSSTASPSGSTSGSIATVCRIAVGFDRDRADPVPKALDDAEASAVGKALDRARRIHMHDGRLIEVAHEQRTRTTRFRRVGARRSPQGDQDGDR